MGPIPTFPKGKEHHPNTLKLSGNGHPPLGEGWGGASGPEMGFGYLLIIFFLSRI